MFRESNNFVYGYYKKGDIAGVGTDFILPLSEYKNEINEVAVLSKTVGQYTGLTDKNGVKIFEGDIVELFVFRGQIIQMCGAFGVSVEPAIDWDYLASEINPVTGCDNSPFFCQNDNFVSLWELMWNYNQEENMCDVIEVIGNIHDNPELLGGIENKS